MKSKYNATGNCLEEQPGVEKVEEWRDIPGYEGFYQVSNKGKVKSLDRWITRNDGLTYFVPGDELSVYLTRGYACLTLSKAGNNNNVRVHQIVARVFIPNPEKKRHINHLNSIRHDNRVENLEWCTPKENTAHMRRSANAKTGRTLAENMSWCKLTKQDVFDLYDHLRNGGTIQQFADLKNVQTRTITPIINGSAWKYLGLDWANVFTDNSTEDAQTAMFYEFSKKLKAGVPLRKLIKQYVITKK